MVRRESPIVREVRQRRMQLSKDYRHDLRAYVSSLKRIENERSNQVVNQVTVVRSKRTST